MVGMNKLKVLKTVTAHLLKQACHAVEREGGKCMYRGLNGTKCAVGCLISDEYYSAELEHNSPDMHLVRKALEKSLGVSKLTHGDLTFLRQLQQIHDNYQVKDWARILAAQKENITVGGR